MRCGAASKSGGLYSDSKIKMNPTGVDIDEDPPSNLARSTGKFSRTASYPVPSILAGLRGSGIPS